MPDITVPVPEDRVADFYLFFGQWLGGDLQTGSRPQVDGYGTPSPSADTRLAWAPEDDAEAEQYWRKLSVSARGLFTLLMEEPGKQYTGNQIADAIGIENGANGVAGVLAWPGRHSWPLNRQLPWQWKVGEDGTESVYWIEPGIAELFGRARATVEGS
jgi:hypothetical protein